MNNHRCKILSNEEYIRESLRASNHALELERPNHTCSSETFTHEDGPKPSIKKHKNINVDNPVNIAAILNGRCFGFKGATKYLDPKLVQIYEVVNGKGKHNKLYYEDAPTVAEVIESLDIYISVGSNKLEILLDGYAAGNELCRILIDSVRGSGIMKMSFQDIIVIFENIFNYDYKEIDKIHPLSIAAIGSFMSETTSNGDVVQFSNTGISTILSAATLLLSNEFISTQNSYKGSIAILNFILPMLNLVNETIELSASEDVKIELCNTTLELLNRFKSEHRIHGTNALYDALMKAIKSISNETNYNLFYAERTIQMATYYIYNIVNRVNLSNNYRELNV